MKYALPPNSQNSTAENEQKAKEIMSEISMISPRGKEYLKLSARASARDNGKAGGASSGDDSGSNNGNNKTQQGAAETDLNNIMNEYNDLLNYLESPRNNHKDSNAINKKKKKKKGMGKVAKQVSDGGVGKQFNSAKAEANFQKIMSAAETYIVNPIDPNVHAGVDHESNDYTNYERDDTITNAHNENNSSSDNEDRANGYIYPRKKEQPPKLLNRESKLKQMQASHKPPVANKKRHPYLDGASTSAAVKKDKASRLKAAERQKVSLHFSSLL